MHRLMTVFAAVCVADLAAIAAEPASPPIIATAEGETAGMSLQVRELKVGNGTVMLKFTIVNDGNKSFDPDNLSDRSVPQYDAHSISGVYLIDATNKKKYLAMYDSANQCVCSRNGSDIAPKSSANLWVKFTAPPDSVKKIGVVVPHFQPLDDVPLSH
jgi:hypothetical protein